MTRSVDTMELLRTLQQQTKETAFRQEKPTAPDLIGFEFEIEREQRIVVVVTQPERFSFTTECLDIYDTSGRVRIRVKNGIPRMGIKIPMLKDQPFPGVKECLRIELKPKNPQQMIELLTIASQMVGNSNTQVLKKRATPITLTNGAPAWLNHGESGEYWIESDMGEEPRSLTELLPEGITFVSYEKSKVSLQNRDVYTPDQVAHILRQNTQALSRTASGKVDTSVSAQKEGTNRSTAEIQTTVEKNNEELLRYLLHSSLRDLSQINTLIIIWEEIAKIINNDITSGNPLAFRTWDVPYGRKVPHEDLPKEMESFFTQLTEKITNIRTQGAETSELLAWIEYEFDRNIHPLADGCGRVGRALSMLVGLHFNTYLPVHTDRKEYYGAMNTSWETFQAYYDHKVQDGKTLLLR